jgi:hypothetical protein
MAFQIATANIMRCPPMGMCPLGVGHSHTGSIACMIPPHACHMHRLLPYFACSQHVYTTRDCSSADALCDMMRGGFLPCKGISIFYCTISYSKPLSFNARLLLSYGCRRSWFFVGPHKSQVNVFSFAGKHHMHGGPAPTGGVSHCNIIFFFPMTLTIYW